MSNRMRGIAKQVAKLERLYPPHPTGPRLVRIYLPPEDGQRPDDPPVVAATEADCRARGWIWIPDVDDRPDPDLYPYD